MPPRHHARPAAVTEPGYEDTGNILLDRLYGAIIHDIAWDEDRNAACMHIADDLRADRTPAYLVPYGASDALARWATCSQREEILRERPDAAWIVHASGSAGTQAGLVAGCWRSVIRRGSSASTWTRSPRASGPTCAVSAARSRPARHRPGWDDDASRSRRAGAAGAYGVADATTEDAIRVAARCEALALDPVYSGKGMAGLIGLARHGRFRDGGPVVWIHTGGSPGIFAYPTTMARLSRYTKPH